MQEFARILIALAALVVLLAPGAVGTPAAPVVAHRTLLLPPAAADATPTEEWATFHGSENHSGYTPMSGPNTLEEGWSACPTQLSIRSGPVADANSVYVADSLGTIFALNRSHNESLLWSTPIYAEPTDMDVVDPYLVIGTSAGGLVALYASNGSLAWAIGLGSRIAQGVSVYDGSVYVGDAAGDLWSMNLINGVTEWRDRLLEPITGMPAAENGLLYVPTVNGTIFAVSTSGAIAWTAHVPNEVETAVAVTHGMVVVGDLGVNVTALNASTGALLWQWKGPAADSVHASAAIGDGFVYVQGDSEAVYALSEGNGTLAWASPPVYSGGYPSVGAPALTPTGLYVVINGIEVVIDLNPYTGALRWTSYSAYDFVFSSPAVIDGDIVFGVDNGCVISYGPSGHPPLWPVSGVVETPKGAPIEGVEVSLAGSQFTTGPNGTFVVEAPNGSYQLTAFLVGHGLYNETDLVAGPQGNLTLVLYPLYLYPVRGVVIDRGSGRGIAGATVQMTYGPLGYIGTTTTGPDGSFEIGAPNSTNYLSASGGAAYDGVSESLVVAGGGISGIVLGLYPSALAAESGAPWYSFLFFEFVGVTGALLGVVAVRVRALSHRRIAEGLPAGILSPFGRYVLMRCALLPGQIAVALAVLYAFGGVLRPEELNESPCRFSPEGWSSFTCNGNWILNGYGQFVVNLVQGNWGYAAYGHLKEPVTTFLQWWFPASFELAIFSLGFALLLGYPVGLVAGWRRGGAIDVGSRAASMFGLLFPTFAVALLLLLGLYDPFLRNIGDNPYGLTPSNGWYVAHGGFPSWIGLGGGSTPTGIPVIDGIIHRDWPFELVVLSKALLQSLIIAIVYVAVFLRYARTVVVDSARSLYVTAARARGVDEETLLWGHTARRVLPYYVLIFALTLPVFIGTQALVEVIFSDAGVGTLLFAGITALSTVQTGVLGFTNGVAAQGAFEQAAVFLLVILVLGSTLLADIVSRYLDPSRSSEAR